MIELVRENRKVISSLFLLIGVFIILSLMFNAPFMSLTINRTNNFLSNFFMGLSGSLISALFVFLAIDLTLRRRRKEEVEPKKRAAYRRISKLFFNLNSLMITIAQEGADEDWEPPTSYKNLYTEEVADKLTEVNLNQSAPTPELDLTWGNYLIMELDRLVNRLDNIEIKYADCLSETISADLDYDLGYRSLNNLEDWAITIMHANKEGRSGPYLPSPFTQRALQRINKVASKVEDNMEEENNINRMNNYFSREGDLRPWAENKFSIKY